MASEPDPPASNAEALVVFDIDSVVFCDAGSTDVESEPGSEILEVTMSREYSPLTMADLPTSLQGWRDEDDILMHRRWMVFQQIFRDQGLLLFVWLTTRFSLKHPDNLHRSLDEPLLWKLPDLPAKNWAAQLSGLVHPACLSIDDRWVMIRLVRLGDEGISQLEVIRFLSAYPNRADCRNHCLPCIKELTVEAFTFCVFPHLFNRASPRFGSYREVFEYVLQTIEGLAFLHSHFIAHRDIAAANILVNLAGHATSQELASGWRSQFPIRYYFIDFEFAIQFDSGTPQRLCRVTGRPSPRFGRPAAPEVYSEEPYNPFVADVFALGLVFFDYFQRVNDPVFLSIIERMLSIEPSARPSAADLLCAFHSHREILSSVALAGGVDPSDCSDPRIHPNARLPPEYQECS